MFLARRHRLKIHHHRFEQMQELFQVDHLDMGDFPRVWIDRDTSYFYCCLPQPLNIWAFVNSKNHLVAVSVNAFSRPNQSFLSISPTSRKNFTHKSFNSCKLSWNCSNVRSLSSLKTFVCFVNWNWTASTVSGKKSLHALVDCPISEICNYDAIQNKSANDPLSVMDESEIHNHQSSLTESFKQNCNKTTTKFLLLIKPLECYEGFY